LEAFVFHFSRLSRRATLAFVLGVTTVSAAGAATFHRLATTGSTGSGGAVATVQTTASGSAIQGEVASSANTSIKLPFGVLGEYNAAGSTFGVGVIGLSTTGYAVGGESLSDTQPSILAYPGGKGIGLEAVTQSTSTSPAIYALSNGTGDGIDGAATNSSAIAGVVGEDLSNSNGYTDGVYGSTTDGGYGVVGVSSDDALGGVQGSATNSNGVYGVSSTGDGVLGTSNATSDEGNFSIAGGVFQGAYISLLAQTLTPDATSRSYPLDVRNETGNDLFFVDNTGNVTYHGSLISNAHTRSGAVATMYAAKTSTPTLEDVGTGQLVGGMGRVAIDPVLIAQMDRSTTYHVFLTPDGDTRGLYVASKSPTGFVVRETQGGRGTLAFDYRIVAYVDGEATRRMALGRQAGPSDFGRGSALVRSTKSRAAQDRVRNRHRFVAPPVTFMPQPASFAAH
jgi:hypothetical protein